MPKLPSIFEDENFVQELYGVLNKTAQIAVTTSASPADIQLALDMVDSYSGLPRGQIAPGSSVSVLGGMTPEKQPSVSDLYSLDAFINYLAKNNFKFGGSPGSTGLALVTPGRIGKGEGDVNVAPNSGLVQYVSKNPPQEYVVNKEGLIEVLKEMASQAAKSGNLYFEELANRLTDDAISNPQLQVEKTAFDAEKQQIDPRAAKPAQSQPEQSQLANQKAPGQQAQTTSTNVPASNKQMQSGAVGQLIAASGANSAWDWLPFYPDQGIIDFGDMEFFVDGLNRMMHSSQALANQLGKWANALAMYRNFILQSEQQFQAHAPGQFSVVHRIIYNYNSPDPVRDFQQQFPAAPGGQRVAPNTGFDLTSQITMAQAAASAISNTLNVLKAVQETSIYSDLKNEIDAQLSEGTKLYQGMQDVIRIVQNQVNNLPYTLGIGK